MRVLEGCLEKVENLAEIQKGKKTVLSILREEVAK